MSDKKKPASVITSPVFSNISETERLKRDVYRSDIEKLALFTQMLRNNALYKKANISHK